MTTRNQRAASAFRLGLGAFLAVFAFNAFGGGVYGLAGAKGFPRSFLVGSPFHTFFVPSLILFVVVGGAFLAASIAVLAQSRTARFAVLAAGAIALGWIAIQVVIIGYVSALQPVVAISAVVVIALGTRLPRASEA
jgi:hypothetical protein